MYRRVIYSLQKIKKISENIADFRVRIGNPPWERNFGRVESSEGSDELYPKKWTKNPLKRSKMPIAISYGEKYYEHF